MSQDLFKNRIRYLIIGSLLVILSALGYYLGATSLRTKIQDAQIIQDNNRDVVRSVRNHSQDLTHNCQAYVVTGGEAKYLTRYSEELAFITEVETALKGLDLTGEANVLRNKILEDIQTQLQIQKEGIDLTQKFTESPEAPIFHLHYSEDEVSSEAFLVSHHDIFNKKYRDSIGRLMDNIAELQTLMENNAAVKIGKQKTSLGHFNLTFGIALLVTCILLGLLSIRNHSKKLEQEQIARKAAQRYEQDMREAQQMAKMGYWTFYTARDKSPHFSKDLREIYGIDEVDDDKFWAAVNARVHPDDLERVIEVRDEGIVQGKPFEYTYRFRDPKGEGERYIRVAGRPRASWDGEEGQELFGFTQDITEYKRLENELRLSEHNLHSAMETAKLGYWTGCLEEQFFIGSKETHNIYGFEQKVGEPIPLQDLLDRIHPDDVDWVTEKWTNASKNRELVDITYRLAPVEGKPECYVRVTARTRESSPQKTEFVGFVQDISEQKQLENELRTSEHNLHSAMEIAKMGSWIYNIEKQTFIAAHETYNLNDIEGVPGQEVQLQKVLDAIHGDDVKRVAAEWKKACETESVFNVTYRVLPVEGKPERYVQVTAAPRKNSSGKTEFIGFTQDVSEQKQLENELLRSEHNLHSAMEIAKMGYWIYDVATKKAHFSEKLREIYGISEEENDSDAWNILLSRIHPDDLEKTRVARESVIIEGKPCEYSYRLRDRDGQGERYIRVAGRPRMSDDGAEVQEYFGFSQDITEQKQLESELRLSEHNLHSAMEIAKLGYWIGCLDDNTFIGSKEIHNIYGFKQEVGEPIPLQEILDRIHPDDVGWVAEKWATANENEGIADITYRLAPVVGKPERYVHVTARTRKSSSGKTEFIGFVQDVTEQKQLENELRRSEYYLHSAMDTAKMGCWVYSYEKDSFTGSQELYSLYGLEKKEAEEELHLQDFLSLIHQDEVNFVAETWQQAHKDKGLFDVTYRLTPTEGEPDRYVHVTGIPHKNSSGKFEIVGFTQDVSEQKILQNELVLSEYNLHSALEIAKMGCWVFNLEEKTFTLAQETYRLINMERVEQEVQLQEVFDAVHPDDLERVVTEWTKACETESVFNITHRVLPVEGKPERYVQVTAAPRKNSSGKTEFIGFTQDVSEQKQLENDLLRSEYYLHSAMGIAKVGYWIYSYEKGTFIGSKELYNLYHLREERAGEVLLLQDFLDLAHPDEVDWVAEKWKQARERKGFFDITYRLTPTKLAPERYVHVTGIPLTNAAGELEFVGFTQDISEQKILENELVRSEYNLHSAMKIAKAGYWVYNFKNETFTGSDELYSLFSLKGDVGREINLQEFFEAIHPDDVPMLDEAWARSVDTGGPYDVTYRLKPIAGKPERYVHDFGHFRKNALGESEFIGFSQDISEQKQLENELLSSEYNLHSALEIAKLGCWIYCVETDTLTGSEEMYSIYDLKKEVGEEIQVQDILDCIHRDDVGWVTEKWAKARGNEEFIDITYRLVPIEGKPERYLRVTATPRKNSAGTTEFVGFAQDISEQKLLENALRKSELNLIEAMHIAKMGYWTFSPASDKATFSEEFLKILGLDESKREFDLTEMVTKIDPEDFERNMQTRKEAALAGEPFEHICRLLPTETEPTRYLRTVGHPRLVNDEEGIPTLEYFVFSQDVTESKLLEVALRNREKFLEAIQHEAKIGTWEYDPRADLLNVSQETKEICGYPIETYTIEKMLRYVHPADKPKWENALQTSLLTRQKAALTHRTIPAGQYQSERTLHVSGWPQDSVDPNTIFVGYVQDVTQHKQLEVRLEASEKALVEAAKIAHLAQWRYNFEEDMMHIPPDLASLLQLPSSGDIRFAELLSAIHPDDREKFEELFHNALCDFGDQFELVHRAIPKPGQKTRSFYINGWHQKDPDGGEGCVGFWQDITDAVEKSEERQRFDHDLSVAREIQHSLLPPDTIVLEEAAGLHLACNLRAAYEVGGDLYDFAMIDKDRLYVVIGDVSDKGVPASLVMAVCKTLLMTNILALKDPALALRKVNNELERGNTRCTFATVFCGILDLQTNEFTYCNAGHDPPVVISRDIPRVLPCAEFPALGVQRDIEYQNETLQFVADDHFLLYTDGITEAMNQEGEVFGEKSLLKTISKNTDKTVYRQMMQLLAAVDDFCGEEKQFDDIAALCFSNQPLRDTKTNIIKRIVIHNDINELSHLATKLREVAKENDWSKDFLNKLNLVLEEWVVNIITYAFADNTSPQLIDILFWIDDGVLYMEVVDDGKSFDPTTAATPNFDENLDERSIGGLGLHLIAEFMDIFQYSKEARGNVVTLGIELE